MSAEERDAIKAYAESLGMSVNKLLLTALEEYQKAQNEKLEKITKKGESTSEEVDANASLI